MTSSSKNSPPLVALILGLLTLYIVWGSTYLAIRVAVETLPPFLMSAARFFVSGIILACAISATTGFRITLRQCRDNALVGAFLLLGGNGLVSWSEQKIPSGIATLIVSLSPLFLVLLDWLVLKLSGGKRGEAPTPLTFAGIALGFAGLVMLLGPELNRGTDSELDIFRVSALVFACLFWSGGSLISRYAQEPAQPFTAAAVQMLFGGLWLGIAGVLAGETTDVNVADFSSRSLLAWGYLVTVGSLLGFTTFVWLMKHYSPALVATYAYINPLVAVFLGWWILDESVGARVVSASAVIIAGVGLITASRGRAQTRQRALAEKPNVHDFEEVVETTAGFPQPTKLADAKA
jgi:drug/metabolite transporter (DMT)-like permease